MYELVPMQDTPERVEILAEIVTKVCGFDTAFSDFQNLCEFKCVETKQIPDFCDLCKQRVGIVCLAFSTGLTWEVWGDEGVVGVVRLSDISRGEDALGHYIFFDHALSSKTDVLQAVIDWAFEEHEGWLPLKRLTVEIPDFAFALARHASKKLGFGGPFTYTLKGKQIQVEGVKKNSLEWRGHRRDMLSLGLQNPTA